MESQHHEERERLKEDIKIAEKSAEDQVKALDHRETAVRNKEFELDAKTRRAELKLQMDKKRLQEERRDIQVIICC